MAESVTIAPVAESTAELERHRALLEVAEAISLNRNLPGLFRSLAELLQKIVQFDSLFIVLHDAESNTMRLHALEERLSEATDPPCLQLQVEESPGGLVWKTQKSFIFSRDELDTRFPKVRVSVPAGSPIRLHAATDHRAAPSGRDGFWEFTAECLQRGRLGVSSPSRPAGGRCG